MSIETSYSRPLAAPEKRAEAIVGALKDKGLISDQDIAQYAAHAAQRWSADNGAKVVARAWLDHDFRARLDSDATATLAELGYVGPPQQTRIKALFNTPTLQNVVVCTQCSCTAWAVLGFPPDWYKVPEYRARAVRESRQVLRELGLELPSSVQIRMWDTTADSRYFVIPVRPEGTDDWGEKQLSEIVTQDCMIGVANPIAPPL
ncbi:nitrile hydratase subunit alpha [Pandoraea cepalis]|uniref:Cobalt-containing nitrile hydratase subunit alpha n=1 Tax=Pandoraea cepalis TaxID=2508294 RepID=A0A5E4VR59_9BURK|nr:nitrile hydratase subunit alpha [Pandoraea cepalis]VVE13774.1 cobalt-containing nitrile hydratase subunit alpha [Pandoraea cepalis]